jgi:biotin carboxylase
MKKILILGAGIYQVPLIKKARELDLFSIVVSVPGNHPGFEFAGKIAYVDTTDYKNVLELACEEKVDGICTAGTDVAIISLGYACDRLGLPGISYDAACIVNDKARMKDAFLSGGVRTARYFKASTLEECKMAFDALDTPVLIKATDSSGSRGISVVKSEDRLEQGYALAQSVSRQKVVVVEEFIEGEEFGAQAFVENGRVRFILPHGDYVFKGDTGVPIGHFAPYALDPAVIEDCKNQLTRAINSAKLCTCAINADFILKGDKVYVLEIGARSGATCLAELTSIYYGIDYYAQIIKAALGEKTDFVQRKNMPNASMLLYSNKPGIIKSIRNENPPDARIAQIKFDYAAGDRVRAFRVGPDRIGHVITRAETLDEAVEMLHTVLSNIHVEVQ